MGVMKKGIPDYHMLSIQTKKTFLTYVGNVFFLFFVINKSNTIKVAYTKILFLIDMPNEAK